MSAAEVFKLKRGDVVSFVGAGGKTSLVSTLAISLSREFSVCVTTTTRVLPFNSKAFDNIFGTGTDFVRHMANIGSSPKVPAFFGGRDSDGKCLPPDVTQIEDLAEAFDIVLVEADGARGKSLKIPRANEPVVPDISNKVVWLTGADVINRTFSDELVFRPEIFGEHGFSNEDEIDLHTLRRALYIPGGYIDRIGECEVYFVLNKIDAAPGFNTDDVRLLWHPRLSGLLLSGISDKCRFFREIANRKVPVSAVILAAGSSERFGSQKLLTEFRGKQLICRAVDAAMESGSDKTVVVIPVNSPDLREAIGTREKVEIVENPDAGSGLSSSIKAGLEKVSELSGGFSALMLFLADMPNIDSGIANEVIATWRESGAPVCAPYENGRFGHPVIFHPVMFPEIRRISGDTGCREILQADPDLVKVVVISRQGTQDDIDTRSDLERIKMNGRIL